ncbi:MAG: protein kinase, partial [Spirochaetes bacterium]|nr:protein kinase [Spirochaetota bacterium]
MKNQKVELKIKTNDIIDTRYQILEKLGEGGMSVVFKARDKEKKSDVAIKFLKPGITSSYIEDRIRFKKEVEVISKFNHPNIIDIFGSGEYQNVPFIVIELLKGESLFDYMRKGRIFKVKEVIEIARQILEALSYVHGKNIVHRDLKPDNIMMLSDNKIKLLDFGLALVMELSEIKKEEEIMGTFGYMSPEATGIVNKPVDERSDLYSLGIILYRLVTGDLPFKGKKTSEIMHKHVAVMPQNPGSVNKDLPKEMDDVIMKLLEKEPDLRYQSAVGLSYDLERLKKGEKGFVIGEKDQRIKLTFRVRLVGRQREYDQIIDLFNKTKNGHGNICLIAGEAGIGKSRLAEEIRGYVYESDGLFFIGRCFDQENKIPYQPFKDILDKYIRRMKHLTQRERDEEVKRIKKALGGQMGEIVKLNSSMVDILGDIPELAKLDTTEKENIRFRLASARFFSIMTKQPLVLFLDDLQWADEGSLNLLEEILKIIHRSKLLILGTYRDSEIGEKHSLQKILNESDKNKQPLILISLKLFNYERMRRLISEVLGEEEKKAEDLTRFIMGKTKGNTFFAITLLRELVERNALVWEKGYWKEDWERIEKLKVSANIVDMMLQRIKDLPEDVDRLLRIGSVIGKEFEMLLLYGLMGKDQEDIVSLVDRAIERQLLERSLERGKVVFVHDRIKEAFYAKMGDKERIHNHLKVARTIEEVYKGREKDVIFDMAHHFIAGGDKEKGLVYGLPAAEKAKENYANKEAIRYYEYVKKVLGEKKDRGKEYIRVLEGLGDVQQLEGQYKLSMENYKQLVPLLKDKISKARINQKTGGCLFLMGRTEEGTRILEQTLKLLRFKTPPRWRVVLYLKFAKELIAQYFHRILPAVFINKKYVDDERMLTGVKIYTRLAVCYYFFDMIKSAYLGMISVNLVDKMKDTYEYGWIHLITGPVWIAFRMFSVGEKYVKEGIRTAVKIKNRLLEGMGYAYLAFNCYVHNKLDQSIESGQRSVNILLPLGERFELAIAYCFKWWSILKKGDLLESVKYAREWVDVMKLVNVTRTTGWSLDGLGRSLTVTSVDFDQNLKIISESCENLVKTKDPIHIAMVHAALCWLHLKHNNYQEAIQKGEKGVEIFLTAGATGCWACDVFGFTADAYLAKAQKEELPCEERSAIYKRVKFLIKKAYSWGKAFKPYFPVALRVMAKYYWMKNKRSKAVRYYKKGIRFTEKYGYKYELALLYLEFGERLYKEGYNNVYDKEKGEDFILKAKNMMEKVAALPDIKRVNRILGLEEKKIEITTEVTPRERLQLEREMTTVLDTITFISSILDLDVLLEKVIDKAMQLSGAERGILFLYPEAEKQERVLKPRVVRNVKETDLEEEGFHTSRGVIEKVEREKQSLMVEDATEDELWKSEVSVVRYGLRSVLCIPILHREDLLGIIYLDNRLVSGLFTQENLRVLEVLAKQAG